MASEFFKGFGQGLFGYSNPNLYSNPYLFANWRVQPPKQEKPEQPTGKFGTVAAEDGTTDWKATMEKNPSLAPKDYARRARQSNWTAMRANKQAYTNAYRKGLISYQQMMEGRRNTFNNMYEANRATRDWRDTQKPIYEDQLKEMQETNYNAMNNGTGMRAYLLKNGGEINYNKVFK